MSGVLMVEAVPHGRVTRFALSPLSNANCQRRSFSCIMCFFEPVEFRKSMLSCPRRLYYVHVRGIKIRCRHRQTPLSPRLLSAVPVLSPILFTHSFIFLAVAVPCTALHYSPTRSYFCCSVHCPTTLPSDCSSQPAYDLALPH